MEEQITKYYLIQNSDKVLKHIDVFEIVSLLDSGKLDGNSYVFDLRIKKWCLVQDIRVLKDTFYEFKDSDPKECPDFTPPHKLPTGEFSSDIDSDYEYLLQYTLGLSKTISESKESTLEIMLEDSECKLAEKNYELEGIKSINLELEDIIQNLKNENSELNNSLVKLENEKIDSLKLVEEVKANAVREVSVLKTEHQFELDKSLSIEKVNFKLSERNKSLVYALKLERSQNKQLKILLRQDKNAVPKASRNDELLSKAMDYLLRGPAGGEQELLEKKISLLTNELKDIEKFFNDKIIKIKDEHSKEIHSMNMSFSDDRSKLNSLVMQKDEFENKYREILSENKSLHQDLESSRAELSSLKHELSSLNSELSLRKSESSDEKSLKNKYINLASQFKELEQNYKLEVKRNKKKIESSFVEENASVKHLKEELNKSRNQVESLQYELAVITSERDSLYDERDGHYESDVKIDKLINNLRSDNKQLITKYNSLKERTAKYKKAYNDLSDSHKKLKRDYSERSEQFNKLKKQSEDIIDSLNEKFDGVNDNYSEKLKELEEAKSREKTLMLKIDEFKNTEVHDDNLAVNDLSDKSDDEELNRLIGDAFEVTNERIWMVARDGQEPTGPYDFSEIYNMKINGELDKNVKIKKGTEFYKVKSDIFELSVPVSTHGSGNNTRYFIKRTSMRVPFYELVTFEINGVEHRGYCTSLSLGGIFIELNKLSDDLTIDKKGRILFSAGALDNPFQCVAQVKNISTARPKGIGLMFVDLPEVAKDDITFYINNYLNKTKQVA